MQFSNKFLINITYLSLFVVLIGLIGLGISHPQISQFLGVGGVLFMITTGYLLLKNGSFIRTREYRLMHLGIAFILIGIMLMVMHWSYGWEITLLGYASFPVVYFVYMIRQGYFNLDKILKLILLLSLVTGRVLRMEHWPYWEYFAGISLILMVYLFIEFIRNKNVKD